MASEQKEKLIRFYKGTEGEETVVKLVDPQKPCSAARNSA